MVAIVELLDELAAESTELDHLVAELAPAQWNTPTPAPGWTVAQQIAHLAWTDDIAFAVNDRPVPDTDVRVELTSPDGDTWTWGAMHAAERVTGSAFDFCLLVTQRRHRDDLDVVAAGPVADRWLHIAQAFAGPPGAGREPAAPAEGMLSR